MLSYAVASQVATKLKIPALFIGEYRGFAIEYFWITSDYDAWDGDPISTIVIKTSRGLYGFYAHDSGFTTEPIKIDSHRDEVVELLQKYDSFPSDEFVFDGSGYSIAFISRNEYYDHSIENFSVWDAQVNCMSDNALLLSKAIFETKRKIVLKSSFPLSVYRRLRRTLISIRHTLLNFSTEKKEDECFDSNNKDQEAQQNQTNMLFRDNYLDFLKIVQVFDLSGIFGEDESPHDLEYVLRTGMWVYVKTKRWFRGVSLSSDQHEPIDISFDIFREVSCRELRDLIKEALLIGKTSGNSFLTIELYEKCKVSQLALEYPQHFNQLNTLNEIYHGTIEYLQQSTD